MEGSLVLYVLLSLSSFLVKICTFFTILNMPGFSSQTLVLLLFFPVYLRALQNFVFFSY